MLLLFTLECQIDLNPGSSAPTGYSVPDGGPDRRSDGRFLLLPPDDDQLLELASALSKNSVILRLLAIKKNLLQQR